MSQLPSFLIIGAQKCGTTWLHHQLREHPDIYLPERKDHEFFSFTQSPNDHQVTVWSERYTAASQASIIGDATASYYWTQLAKPWHLQPDSFNPDIPKSVLNVLGNKTKIIIILRNPVDRAISAYAHHISMGSLTPNWDIFSAPANLGLLTIGFFGQHLSNWLKYFPQESIYVERRSIKQLHQKILTDICAFLDVPAYTFGQSSKVIYRGMPRQINQEGVWLRLQDIKNITAIQRALPITIINDERYIRVIHPAEIKRLTQLYSSDQQLLDRLLDGNKSADS